MNLRDHIDLDMQVNNAKVGSKTHKRAVLVNYKMGLASGEKRETDISQLTKLEKGFLKEAGLLPKRKRK